MFALIDRLRVHFLVEDLCDILEVNRSSYYAYKARRRKPDVQRVSLRAKVTELFNQSRGFAGSGVSSPQECTVS